MVAIIDYGAGNLHSVAKAIQKLGYQPCVSSQREEIERADVIIFPGVGSAGDATGNLKKLGLDVTLKKLNSEKRPIFGVCLGLQLFMEYSEEDGGYECLNLLPGTVKKLPPGNKIPHMGWNQVNQVFVHPIFHGIPDGTNFYFVHSYYADVKDKHIVAGVTDYGISFPSIVVRDNLVATQFHPEKSGDLGLMMYKNFLEMYIKK